MNKAIFKYEEYKKYLNTLTENDVKRIYDTYKEKYHGRWNESGVKKLSKAIDDVIHISMYSSDRYKAYMYREDKIQLIHDYVTLNGFYWDVEFEEDIYVVIKYGEISLFVFKEFVEIFPENNYSDMSPIEVRNKLLGSKQSIGSLLPSELSETTLNNAYSTKINLNDKLEQLKQEMEDVKNNKTSELAAIQKEIDDKLAELQLKKDSLLESLNGKMAEFKDKLRILKNQIFMLKTEIYSIRCFAGETVELIQIREGKRANIETPIVLNQKILYLDEDLAKTISIYQDDITSKYSLLEEALKYNDTIMNMFCPQEKSISFFKLSKTGITYQYDFTKDLMEHYNLLHGKKMGFVVRNGENVYVGWLEEDWDTDTSDRDSHKLTFDEDVIFKPEIKTVEDDKQVNNTSPNEAVSRFFAINVLQGLIEHKSILQVPEKINITIPNKYVIHNYAEGWIEDDRYGYFDVLTDNLHNYNKQGDTILVIQPMSETEFKAYYSNRSRGDRNMTRDCYVESGLNTINLIENNLLYVSAKKENNWDGTPRRNSNFNIDKNEFVNITFMNSDWMRYYIDTKKIGQFSNVYSKYGNSIRVNYSYLVRYFNIAYQFLKNREIKEYELISKYFVDIDKLSWKDLLSHWKIKNDVRVITEYQAKRFAKYLESGKYYKIKNLFEQRFDFPSYTKINVEYYQTSIAGCGRDSRYLHSNTKHPGFGWDDFNESDVTFSKDSSKDDILKREVKDIEKIEYIKSDLINVCKENKITLNNVLLKRYLLNVNNDFKVAYSKTWTMIVNTAIDDDIVNNIDIFNTFKQELETSDYRWHRSISEKLKKLLFILYVQRYYYTDLESSIMKIIHYNISHDIEFI